MIDLETTAESTSAVAIETKIGTETAAETANGTETKAAIVTSETRIATDIVILNETETAIAINIVTTNRTEVKDLVAMSESAILAETQRDTNATKLYKFIMYAISLQAVDTVFWFRRWSSEAVSDEREAVLVQILSGGINQLIGNTVSHQHLDGIDNVHETRTQDFWAGEFGSAEVAEIVKRGMNSPQVTIRVCCWIWLPD